MMILLYSLSIHAASEVYTLSLHDALPIYRAHAEECAHRRPIEGRPETQFEFQHVRCNGCRRTAPPRVGDRKSTRLNSSHITISYAVFCLKKNKQEMALQANQYARAGIEAT